MEEMVQPNIAMAEAGVRLNVCTTSCECVGLYVGMSHSFFLLMRAWIQSYACRAKPANLVFFLVAF